MSSTTFPAASAVSPAHLAFLSGSFMPYPDTFINCPTESRQFTLGETNASTSTSGWYVGSSVLVYHLKSSAVTAAASSGGMARPIHVAAPAMAPHKEPTPNPVAPFANASTGI